MVRATSYQCKGLSITLGKTDNEFITSYDRTYPESSILMKFGKNVVFKKIFRRIFSIGNGLEGVETTLEIRDAKHILLSITGNYWTFSYQFPFSFLFSVSVFFHTFSRDFTLGFH